MRGVLLSGAGALVFAACAQGAPAVATEVPFAAACDNDGERVAVQGYLRLPRSFTGDFSVVLRLYETDAFTGEPLGVTLRFGSEPNHIDEVPTSFADEDLLVHLDDGTTAGFGTQVRVSGKVYEPLVAQDFECGLTDVLVEAAGS